MRYRIESLDWLRGLMAVVIMFYHLTYWHFYPLDSSFFLGRFGVYGVSVFFVLSGLSMAIVYSGIMVGKASVSSFYIKRIFRIWPLLWACILLATIPIIARGDEVSVVKLLLNFTTLFGFISPGDYINTGAWSIGNEMVYYAFTPIILIIFEKNRTHGNILLLLTFIIALVFAFVLLNSQGTLTEQWGTYINPFNNIFLYVGGIAIFYNLKNVQLRPAIILLLFCASVATFAFFPVDGDKIAIVTGVNRIVFLAASVALVISFFKFNRYDLVPKSIQFPLEQFGIATYGVYLLHPIVNSYAAFLLDKTGPHSPTILFAIVVIITIIFAIISFHLFEKRMMKIGKLIASEYNKS